MRLSHLFALDSQPELEPFKMSLETLMFQVSLHFDRQGSSTFGTKMKRSIKNDAIKYAFITQSDASSRMPIKSVTNINSQKAVEAAAAAANASGDSQPQQPPFVPSVMNTKKLLCEEFNIDPSSSIPFAHTEFANSHPEVSGWIPAQKFQADGSIAIVRVMRVTVLRRSGDPVLQPTSTDGAAAASSSSSSPLRLAKVRTETKVAVS